MNFMLDVQINSPEKKINYRDPVMLVGSCFTEHIGNNLQELKFEILQNPNGILFDPQSVSSSIISYINSKKYSENDLIYLNELWQSWNHHSVFSNIDKGKCLQAINDSQEKAHQFLKKSKWLIVTLGSSFSYRLKENNQPVANCHRAPAQLFDKHLMTIEEINSALDNYVHQLFQFNPNIRIIFTVSPVRHIRDGVIDNNRSKARLIECVHHLVNKFDNIYYFPTYELVIDVLRDYRFYDIDMVHPNYQATEFVLQKFVQYYVDEESTLLMEEIKKIVIARKHKAFNPSINAHKKFLKDHFAKVALLKSKHSFLNFEEELSYFSNNSK
ncbi:MAG TPA: GSCFA domain-containing protein [Puia sp.]